MDTSRDNGTGEEPTDRHGHQQGQRERSPHRHGVKAMPTAPGGALDTARKAREGKCHHQTVPPVTQSPFPRHRATLPQLGARICAKLSEPWWQEEPSCSGSRSWSRREQPDPGRSHGKGLQSRVPGTAPGRAQPWDGQHPALLPGALA